MTENIPDTAPMQAAGQDLVTRAEAMTIASNEDAQRAGALLIDVKALVKKIESEFKDPKQKAHETHKAITLMEKRMLELPTAAEAVLKRNIGAWQVAENRRIQEEQRRLQAEAEARAREVRRLEEEDRRREYEARKREEENRRLEEAARLEEAGQKEAAEATIAAPMPDPPPPPVFAPIIVPSVKIEQPKIKGISTSTLKRFRIVDAGAIDRAYLIPDEQKIRKLVEACGKDAEKIVGGIEFYEEPVTRVGSR